MVYDALAQLTLTGARKGLKPAGGGCLPCYGESVQKPSQSLPITFRDRLHRCEERPFWQKSLLLIVREIQMQANCP